METRPRPDIRAAALVFAGVVSVQGGAALATTIFDELGPGGAVFLRSLSAALIVAALFRPRLRGRPREHLRLAALFGVALAAMNYSIYEALDRIPLGVAVTLEFVGPLAVAVLGSRRPIDLVWVLLAGFGIVLLSGGLGGQGVDALGAAFALAAGAAWGAYILISARVGAVFPGGSGLAVAMSVALLLVAPVGIADGGGGLLDLRLLAIGGAVGLLSSVIPYSFELEALRTLRPSVFGVLMSLEPAVAVLIGFIALDQGLAAVEALAIALVVLASAGALRAAATPPPVDT